MWMAKVPKQEKPQATQQQGVVYLTHTGVYGKEQDITAQKLYNLKDNVYAMGVAAKQKNLIHSDVGFIEALNPQGEVDEKLQNRLTEIFLDNPEVDFNSRAVQGTDGRFWFGLPIFNQVWEFEGSEYVLKQLTGLPEESFDTAPPGAKRVYSPILKGVYMNDQGEIEFWQRDGIKPKPEKLDTASIFIIRDPHTKELTGRPIIKPLVPVLEMLSFTWNAQMQAANRIGAPIMFLKITDPKKDDIAYGEMVLQKWGKDNQFPLRANMEPIFPNITDRVITTQIIDALNWMIIDYMTPSSFISKGSGTLIGGSDAEQGIFLRKYIMGHRNWVCGGLNQLLKRYLVANRYEGFKAVFKYPELSEDKSLIKLQQAQVGAATFTLEPNEVRERLEAAGVDDDYLPQIKAKWDALKPQAAPNPFQPPGQYAQDATQEAPGEGEAAGQDEDAQGQQEDEQQAVISKEDLAKGKVWIKNRQPSTYPVPVNGAALLAYRDMQKALDVLEQDISKAIEALPEPEKKE
jgi:hypothetical protein